MRRIYFASASAGSREFLSVCADLLATHHLVFSPMLGFKGKETPEIREKGLEADKWLIENWAEVVVVLYEGVVSEGIWLEADLAIQLKLPFRVYSPFGNSPLYRRSQIKHWKDVIRWLDGL